MSPPRDRGRAMRDAAFHGLAGEVVGFLEPHTEADMAGLLLSFLSAFGAAVGSDPHAVADGSRHPARLNVVLVGRSSRARKGTSWSVMRKVFDHAAPDFVGRRVIGWLASGEGLVADLASRDGDDRSVLVHEPEFARFLRVGSRSASLSALVREAWDGGTLAVRTRNKPLRAEGANVAVLGHVTAEELRRRLNATEVANGFANRFLFCWVERSKRLPSGGNLPIDDLEVLGLRVGVAVERARQLGTLTRTPAAEQRWADLYNSLDDEVDGVVGSLTARAEAQILRLSVAYALLDASETIDVAHLDAAESVWEHCAATVERVFARRQPDWVVPRLLEALAEAGAEGLDGSAQRDVFQRHLDGARLAAARGRPRSARHCPDCPGRDRRTPETGHPTRHHGDDVAGRPRADSSLSSLPSSLLPSLSSDQETPAILTRDNRTVSTVSIETGETDE